MSLLELLNYIEEDMRDQPELTDDDVLKEAQEEDDDERTGRGLIKWCML